MNIKQFFSWFISLLVDQRGEVGDLDDDGSDKDSSEEHEEKADDQDEEDEHIVIKGEKEKSEEEKNKEKEKEANAAIRKELDELKKNYEGLSRHKTDLDKGISKLRQENKALKAAKTEEKGETLTDEQLVKILEDNPDDPDMQLRMMKYLAEQIAKGEVDKGVSAAEVNRKSAQFNEFLEEKYPTLFEPDSDIRKDVDDTKKTLGLIDHPYGDYFAVAVNVLNDLPELLEYSFNEGKDTKLRGKAEEKRKEGIEGGKLPSSKDSSKEAGHLSETALETAKQMELTPGQRKAYEKLVGKKPRIVTVED